MLSGVCVPPRGNGVVDGWGLVAAPYALPDGREGVLYHRAATTATLVQVVEELGLHVLSLVTRADRTLILARKPEE
jgi:hypothetical protein